MLAYRTGGVIETQLVRVDRTGRVLGTIGPPGPYPANPSLSPDGTHLAMALFDLESGGSDIWLFDLDRGVRSRFTFDPALELAPLWAADGTRILFASNRAGPWDIHERRVDAAAAAEAADERPLIQSGTNKYPQAMSADGAMLVFTRRLPQTNEDLRKMLAAAPVRASGMASTRSASKPRTLSAKVRRPSPHPRRTR